MHNLHGPDRLFETRYGDVLKCACCDRIQITFREHTLLVDEDELEVLTDTIKHAWETVRDAEGQDRWELQAGTDAGPVSITLAEPSLRTLHILLQGAWSMYSLQERMRAVVGDADDREARDVLHDHVPPASSQWGGLGESS
ncbi:hypothetical protein [Salinibacter grassmerensis]|uniref:hypothetical protein n=1 Tax=Salinibacter grassmerensis TaxID=3040353 RepID=UPI0021E6F9A9|nr:hypothetical protein [Salinibacter grassmerensis]